MRRAVGTTDAEDAYPSDKRRSKRRIPLPSWERPDLHLIEETERDGAKQTFFLGGLRSQAEQKHWYADSVWLA